MCAAILLGPTLQGTYSDRFIFVWGEPPVVVVIRVMHSISVPFEYNLNLASVILPLQWHSLLIQLPKGDLAIRSVLNAHVVPVLSQKGKEHGRALLHLQHLAGTTYEQLLLRLFASGKEQLWIGTAASVARFTEGTSPVLVDPFVPLGCFKTQRCGLLLLSQSATNTRLNLSAGWSHWRRGSR